MSDDDPAWPPSAFWDFSLAFYAEPAVRDACLALQDERGLDVNLILLAAWLARAGRGVEPALARQLRAISDRHQTSIMRPLREARRALDPDAAEPWLAPRVARQRRALLAVELELERLEQLQLERLVTPPASERAAADGALFRDSLATLYPDLKVPSCDVQQLAELV